MLVRPQPAGPVLGPKQVGPVFYLLVLSLLSLSLFVQYFVLLSSGPEPVGPVLGAGPFGPVSGPVQSGPRTGQGPPGPNADLETALAAHENCPMLNKEPYRNSRIENKLILETNFN